MNPLRWLFGPEVGMLTMGDGRPDNSPSDLSALVKAYKEARLAKNQPSPLDNAQWPFGPVGAPKAPSPPISTDNSGPPPAPQAPQVPPPAAPQPVPSANVSLPMAPSVPMPTPRPQMPIPMPQPRPAEAPQPDMGFFARNAAMMRDPMSGDYLDPQAAQRADASGPQVIQKFMNYLHNKA